MSQGIGIYRSTDAGKTWSFAGLPEAGQIGRIRVHPEDPELVWVAALGHVFGDNPERGVYRSRDGGASWELVLHVSAKAGAVDLALDARNPRILYAATWQAHRKPWTMESGGPGSGLWRSKDSGDTWERLEKGLPEGPLGRIGVTISPVDPKRVWALVEAEEGGLFRSDDGGDSFTRISADRRFRQRAWYYSHLFADTADKETLYILNVGLWRSHDGGTSFEAIPNPHGDHHDLWIHPKDPKILIEANDGGAIVSRNAGKSWSSQATQPTAEIYRLSVDAKTPYRLYGSQQDNSTVSLPSRSRHHGITRRDWYSVGGCESGHIAVDPRDPGLVYAGCFGGLISRWDPRTEGVRQIMPWPEQALGKAAKDMRFRFQWNAPIRLSPHDPDVLYHCSQHVHRSLDRGASWEVISPDLSRNDRSKQGYPGGAITYDSTSVEVYGTIFAFEESPHTPGVLWAGTDDGRVHVSRDAGGSWNEVTPKALPEWGVVNTLELSPHAAGRVFLAVTRYRQDDPAPYVFRTNDGGKRWERIADGTRGIPEGHFVRVVREDPAVRGLLYAGTEFGLYVSLDDGKSWRAFQLALPRTPVTDIQLTRGDLALSTQGRGIWVLDDLAPLRAIAGGLEAPLTLPAPKPALRLEAGVGGGAAGRNPVSGVPLRYHVAGESEEPLVLELLDGSGAVLRRIASDEDERRAPRLWGKPSKGGPSPPRLPASPGWHSWTWDMRPSDLELIEGVIAWGDPRGPLVPPGAYVARLTRGSETVEAPIELKPDPASAVASDELTAQYTFLREIGAALDGLYGTVREVRSLREQLVSTREKLEEGGRLDETLKTRFEEIETSLDAIEELLIQPKNEAPQDVLNYPPGLDADLLFVYGHAGSGDGSPLAAEEERFFELKTVLDRERGKLHTLREDQLRKLERALAEAGLPRFI